MIKSQFNLLLSKSRNENCYFYFLLGYMSHFPTMMALRPELKLDFTAFHIPDSPALSRIGSDKIPVLGTVVTPRCSSGNRRRQSGLQHLPVIAT